MSTLLEVKNLKKYFRVSNGWLHAVDDVSFVLGKGKTLVLSVNPGAANPPLAGLSSICWTARRARYTSTARKYPGSGAGR